MVLVHIIQIYWQLDLKSNENILSIPNSMIFPFFKLIFLKCLNKFFFKKKYY